MRIVRDQLERTPENPARSNARGNRSERYRLGQTTTPPSITMVWPVMKLEASEAR